MRQSHPQLSIVQACGWLGISRSWFYAQPDPKSEAERLALRDAIERIVLAFPGYGYRRVTAQLHREGWRVNHKRVLRLMRAECLLCQLQKRFVVTTDSQHALPTYPNLLKHQELTAPDQAWVADLTYIRLPGGFCYLACVLDAYSRVCVGWQLSRDIDTRLTLAALDQALVGRQPPDGVIHHSDRGVQYASQAYRDRLAQAGLRPSMSAKGTPYDNAKAESFFKTLKAEEVWLHDYQTIEEAREHIDPFIAQVYNQKRLHSSLGYKTPLEFEHDFYKQAYGQQTMTPDAKMTQNLT